VKTSTEILRDTIPELRARQHFYLLVFAIIVVLFLLLGLGRSAGQAAQPAWSVGAPNLYTEIHKLRSPEAAIGSNFGIALAVDGDTIVVGEYHHDLSVVTDAGAAYVFYRNQGGPGNWGLVKKIVAPDPEAFDHFAGSLDLYEDTLVIGVIEDDDACPTDPNCDSGSAYIYSRNTGGENNWGLVKKLAASNSEMGDYFGSDVAIDQDTIAVGAKLRGIGANEKQGNVYIFERNQGGAGNWGETKIISDTLGGPFDRFGTSLSLDGDTLAVGAQTFVNAGVTVGAAYVFERDLGGAGNWGQVLRILPFDNQEAGSFGIDVSLDVDLMLVGAPDHSGLGLQQGAAYLYGRNQGGPESWGLVRQFFANDGLAGDRFGYRVAVAGSRIVISALHAEGSGTAYIYDQDSGGAGSWDLFQEIRASDAFANDSFGSAVDFNGQTIAIGAEFDDDACPIDPACNSGSAYLFEEPASGTPTSTPSASPTATPVFSESIYLPVINRP